MKLSDKAKAALEIIKTLEAAGEEINARSVAQYQVKTQNFVLGRSTGGVLSNLVKKGLLEIIDADYYGKPIFKTTVAA